MFIIFIVIKFQLTNEEMERKICRDVRRRKNKSTSPPRRMVKPQMNN